MKTNTIIRAIFITLLLFWGKFSVHAQSLEPAVPEEKAPEKLLAPEVIPVEDIQYGIPGERGLALSGVMQAGPPEPEPVALRDPVVRFPIPGTGITFPPEDKDKTLLTEAVLGAGIQNHIYGKILLLKPGERPNLSLMFEHEALDSSTGSILLAEEPTPFFYHREDTITGDVGLLAGPLTLDLEGSFLEKERGLQKESQPYKSRILRSTSATINTTYKLKDRLRFTAIPETTFTTVLDRGEEPRVPITEYLLGGVLKGELLFEKAKAGLEARYLYRTPKDLHRVGVTLFGNINLSIDYSLYGSAGWLFTSDEGHLFPFPFTVGFTASPISSLTADIRGGYRNREHNLADLSAKYEFMDIPDEIEIKDNPGWYGGLSLKQLLWKGAYLKSGIMVAQNKALPYPGAYNEDIGFFTIDQGEVLSIEPEAEFGWNLRDILDIHAGWKALFPLNNLFLPENIITLEVDARSRSKAFGGGISSSFLTGETHKGENERIQLPYLDLNGFYRFTKNIRAIAEASDLLSLFTPETPRYLWKPYKDFGFLVTIRLQIAF